MLSLASCDTNKSSSSEDSPPRIDRDRCDDAITMHPQSFTFKRADLVNLTGASLVQVQYWLRLGLLTPAAGGAFRGDHREFSVRSVIECAILVELAAMGLNTAHRRTLLATLRAKVDADYPNEEQRAFGTFVKYVESTQHFALMQGRAEDPRHMAWLKHASTVARQWLKTINQPIDSRWMDLLVARKDARPGLDALGKGWA